jgi:hypothetical protein
MSHSYSAVTTNYLTNGFEQWWAAEYRGKAECFSYGFQHQDGRIFQCVETTLEKCRALRDKWLTLIPA